jgi:predicted metal-dependent hydrolase
MMEQPAFAGLRAARVCVRMMEARWGSCAPSGRIWLNSRLVMLPTSLIDYVIAHELCHLRAPKHDEQFIRLLSRVMPDWRTRHGRLQQRLEA